MRPGYLKLYASGELQRRIETAWTIMEHCTICPLNCRVNRISETLGVCGVGRLAPVSSYGPHFGEERPLVGRYGSGTIFFASCNLRCIFCQNYEISHFLEADAPHLGPAELASIMVQLQHQGCHNINLVTPTHVVPHILGALPQAIDGGLTIPLVYNSSGYDAPETLELLDGIVDIYMPDFKFWNNATAGIYTRAENYGDIARTAIKAMFYQVGDLQTDERGLAVRGLLVRHLVMPGNLDETKNILTYISEQISPNCHVNIMDQYRPCVTTHFPIDRPLRGNEYHTALGYAKNTGLVQLNELRLADLLRNLGNL
jgi:putative pyruvate formate lyase activating enzyme